MFEKLKWLSVALGWCFCVIGVVFFYRGYFLADSPVYNLVNPAAPAKPVVSREVDFAKEFGLKDDDEQVRPPAAPVTPAVRVDFAKEFGLKDDDEQVRPVARAKPASKVGVVAFAIIGALAVGTVGFAVYRLRRRHHSRSIFRAGFSALSRLGRCVVLKINWVVVAHVVCGMVIGGCVFWAGCWWIREAGMATMAGGEAWAWAVRNRDFYDSDTREILKNLALVGVLLGGTVGFTVYGLRRRSTG